MAKEEEGRTGTKIKKFRNVALIKNLMGAFYTEKREREREERVICVCMSRERVFLHCKMGTVDIFALKLSLTYATVIVRVICSSVLAYKEKGKNGTLA